MAKRGGGRGGGGRKQGDGKGGSGKQSAGWPAKTNDGKQVRQGPGQQPAQEWEEVTVPEAIRR